MNLTRLKRYSKRRTAGDQTSGGRGKLLRPSTELSRIELVVRETLQNSWDASDEDWYPAYGVHVFEVSSAVKSILRDSIFTELPESLSLLAESLAAPGLRAIEIYDRGTSGLDGPYRASDVSEEGEPNNFNSFVFDIGTTKDSTSSGGTFGFGKTATFEISKPHSVLYWTRCRASNGELEHRLIAASLHDPYAEDGARFTGAHWWGDPKDDDIIPLRGSLAAELGESIFGTHFVDDETGTSILIIDPVVSFEPTDIDGDGIPDIIEKTPARSTEGSQQLVTQITDAIAKNAWSKTVPFDDELDHSPMAIAVYEDDREFDIVSLIHSRYSRYADSLLKVRAAQNDQNGTIFEERPERILKEDVFPIRIRSSRSRRQGEVSQVLNLNDNIVGHLHMAVSMNLSEHASHSYTSNALCLMRNEAELVVQYDKITELENPNISWHGVFKPTAGADRHFRDTEPSTHDSWNPSSAESEISNDLVRRALSSVRRKAREFLAEHKTPERGSNRSVREVSNSLRSFVPFGEPVHENTVVDPKPNTSRRGRKSVTEFVEILSGFALPEGAGQTLEIQLNSAQPEQRREIALAVAAVTSDGRLQLSNDEFEVEWTTMDGKNFRGLKAELAALHPAKVVLTTKVPMVLEVSFEVGQKS